MTSRAYLLGHPEKESSEYENIITAPLSGRWAPLGPSWTTIPNALTRQWGKARPGLKNKVFKGRKAGCVHYWRGYAGQWAWVALGLPCAQQATPAPGNKFILNISPIICFHQNLVLWDHILSSWQIWVFRAQPHGCSIGHWMKELCHIHHLEKQNPEQIRISTSTEEGQGMA